MKVAAPSSATNVHRDDDAAIAGSTIGSGILQRARRVLLEVEDASGDALAGARREVLGRVRDIVRRQQPAERPRGDRLLDPLVAFAVLFALHSPLAFGERPTDVDLVDTNPVAVQKRGS